MADDNAKLLIVLEAQSRKLQNQLVDATRTIDRFANQTNRRFEQMNAKNAQSFERLNANVTRSMGGLNSALAPLLGALGTREIIRYADTWTESGNKIAAAGQVAGRAGRSLESLNEIANETRTGIAETTDLYAKLLRSTKDVAKSEEEVARATTIVNKAFKAGGAAASEQIAGILQLSQGLGSGILQGDELRSLRENAPLLAQAIADEFGTTIAGLKQLGADGELTSARVFQAILNAQSGIEAAFNATNATIGDSFTKVSNALTQYIGTADQTKGAAYALQSGLNALADNFDVVGDVAIKVAAVIAAAMVGRGIGGMIVALGSAGAAVAKFVAIARTAQGVGGLLSALGGLGVAAGPIGAVVGTIAAGAVGHFAMQAAEAGLRTERFNELLVNMGITAKESATQIDEATAAQSRLSTAEGLAQHQQETEDSTVMLEQFRGELEKLAVVFRASVTETDSQVAALSRAVDAYQDGSTSAVELKAELDKLVEANPDWAADVSVIKSWVTQIEQAAAAVAGLATEMSRISDIGTSPKWSEVLDLAYGPQVTTDLGSMPTFRKEAPTFKSLQEFNESGPKPARVTGGGGGSRSDTFGDAKASMQERIDLLMQETAALRELGPLTNDYGFSLERLRATQELQNAAQKAGIDLGPEQVAQIDALANGYAHAVSEAERLAEAQGKVKEAADQLRSAAEGALTSIVDGFIEGKNAGDILNSVVQDLLKNLIKMGINAIGGGLLGGGGIFGAIGGLFGFSEGGYTGDGGKHQPAGVVHKGEYVFSKARTRQLGVANLERLHKGYANGGYVGSPTTVSSRAAAPQQLTVNVITNDEKMSAYVTDHAGRVVGGVAPALIKTSINASPAATAEKQLRYGMG